MIVDYLALAFLLMLVTAAVVIVVLLGMMPGRIARDRSHPQADAISVCGWWGVLTMGYCCRLPNREATLWRNSHFG